MGTHPIFESDFDCLTDEMPASSAGVDGAHTHPLPNGVSYDDFNRIDSIRASQKKRRADDIRNKELSANQNLYQLSKNPPTVGLENAGFEEETWEETLSALESHQSILDEINQLKAFLASSQFKKSAHLSSLLKDEFPHERSLDNPEKLSEALNMSTHPEADELNVFLSDDKLRSVSGIDSDQEQDSSVTAVEQEALQLANNFKGAGHNFASVTIDKNNIFLGATVKNDDAKVVISRIVAGGAVENDSFNVRTLYDYNPDADEYIPCKELGLFFKKGEILKIHRGEDENWWQAYKEGENDMSNLARLVPSTEFEQKRRQINKHLLDEIEKDEEPVLCGNKKKKKKKKKNDDDNEETI